MNPIPLIGSKTIKNLKSPVVKPYFPSLYWLSEPQFSTQDFSALPDGQNVDFSSKMKNSAVSFLDQTFDYNNER